MRADAKSIKPIILSISEGVDAKSIKPVILSISEGSVHVDGQILRCAQNDKPREMGDFASTLDGWSYDKEIGRA